MAERDAARRLTVLGAVLVAVAVAAAIVGVLIRNDGVFSYTLDDPYVHLELARNLAHGHHGVEPGTFSAPSSSVLWPLLLVPAWLVGGAFYAPLVLNLAAAGLLVAGLGAAVARVLGPVADERRGAAGVLIAALVLVADPIALVLTGMEHTLQVALVTWLVVALIELDRDGRAPRWLLPLAVTLPLVRLEDSGVVLLAAGLLAWHRQRALAGAVVLGVVATVGPYLAWIHARTGFHLPFSILSKRDMFPTALDQLADPAVFLPLLIASVALLRARTRDGGTRLLAVAALAAALGHDALAQVGLFHRYVAYVTVFVVLIAGWVDRDAVRAALREGGSNGRVVLWIVGIVAVTNLKLTVDVVGAAGHIWRMHGQLRRVAVEVVDGPVAVNDIGWVTLDNDRPVVDLVGLASADALRHRLDHDPPAWMDALVRAEGAPLVMIYDHWFPALPEGWARIGTLVVDASPYAEPDRRVALFAVDAARAPELRERLAAFAKTLPEGVRIDFGR